MPRRRHDHQQATEDKDVVSDSLSSDEEQPTKEKPDDASSASDNNKDNVGLLTESGLTEEDRRQIRKEQRDLLKELEDKDALDVEEARNRNNRLYQKVRYTREAVLDGENLISIAQKASQKVDRLIQVSYSR
jgi:hypothetical protein